MFPLRVFFNLYVSIFYLFSDHTKWFVSSQVFGAHDGTAIDEQGVDATQFSEDNLFAAFDIYQHINLQGRETSTKIRRRPLRDRRILWIPLSSWVKCGLVLFLAYFALPKFAKSLSKTFVSSYSITQQYVKIGEAVRARAEGNNAALERTKQHIRDMKTKVKDAAEAAEKEYSKQKNDKNIISPSYINVDAMRVMWLIHQGLSITSPQNDLTSCVKTITPGKTIILDPNTLKIENLKYIRKLSTEANEKLNHLKTHKCAENGPHMMELKQEMLKIIEDLTISQYELDKEIDLTEKKFLETHDRYMEATKMSLEPEKSAKRGPTIKTLPEPIEQKQTDQFEKLLADLKQSEIELADIKKKIKTSKEVNGHFDIAEGLGKMAYIRRIQQSNVNFLFMISLTRLNQNMQNMANIVRVYLKEIEPPSSEDPKEKSELLSILQMWVSKLNDIDISTFAEILENDSMYVPDPTEIRNKFSLMFNAFEEEGTILSLIEKIQPQKKTFKKLLVCATKFIGQLRTLRHETVTYLSENVILWSMRGRQASMTEEYRQSLVAELKTLVLPSTASR